MNKTDLPPPDDRPVVLIAGPTASGKSALAMAIAKSLERTWPATIVNADSMQVYRDLRVLTARPSLEDEQAVPHRLFGTIDGEEACSAARWADDAKAAIADGHAAGRLPIVVGGTGLYIRSLLDGIAPIPPIDPDIRAALRALPVALSYAALQVEDPEAAARLAPADSTRVARALEVVRSTGHPIATWQEARTGGIASCVRLHVFVLRPPREVLAAIIDDRFERMFDHAHDEVAALVARRLDPTLPVMRAIGVSQLADFLGGRCDRSTALAAGRLATRQYAKRQATWFSRPVAPGQSIIDRVLQQDAGHAVEIILQTLVLT